MKRILKKIHDTAAETYFKIIFYLLLLHTFNYCKILVGETKIIIINYLQTNFNLKFDIYYLIIGTIHTKLVLH